MGSRAVAVRGIVVLAVATGGLALVTAQAVADHSDVRRASGSGGSGNAEVPAFARDVSADGSRVVFQTRESLVPEDDDDGRQDIYGWSGGDIQLASAGAVSGPAGAEDAFYEGISADGTRIFFRTEERAVPADVDDAMDLFERVGGETVRVSTGPAGGNAERDSALAGLSIDGTRVVFHTSEQMTADDTDSSQDLYLRAGGQTTLLTDNDDGTDAGEHAIFEDFSADGSTLLFSTREQLVPSDTDATPDGYVWRDGLVSLVSVGPAGGNSDLYGLLSGAIVSADGTRVLFGTAESLVAEDVDSEGDVYLNVGGVVTLVSPGTANEFAGDAFANPSLTTILFGTAESLDSEDGDATSDLYSWRNGTVALESTGPSGGDTGDVVGEFVSTDGARLVFSTAGALTPDDTDTSTDLYERFAGQTRKLTPGNGAANALFDGAAADGSRVFFSTPEALVPGDQDNQSDIYESSAPGVHQVSAGSAAAGADFDAVSANGGVVAWDTAEPVTGGDTDSVDDAYVSRVPAPAAIAPPAISGTPSPGQTLTCHAGTWRDAESFAYLWNRDGVAIAGATTPTYVVQAGDAGDVLTCTVTATGDGGTTSATSAPVAVPSSGTGPLPGACANAQVGTSGRDDMEGTPDGDLLYGLGGKDRIRGLGSADCLVGGPGRDRLVGGPGRDRLVGGGRDDVLAGGERGDRLVGGRGVDRLRGGTGKDALVGGRANDRLVAGAGPDVVRARDGRADEVRCGAGHDKAVVDAKDDVTGCEVVVLD